MLKELEIYLNTRRVQGTIVIRNMWANKLCQFTPKRHYILPNNFTNRYIPNRRIFLYIRKAKMLKFLMFFFIITCTSNESVKTWKLFFCNSIVCMFFCYLYRCLLSLSSILKLYHDYQIKDWTDESCGHW